MASTPADRDNFTALLKELRAAFGHKKLVTIAVGANAESPKSWVDVKAIAPLLDYINLMTYDMAYGTQYFNANLYDSSDWPTVRRRQIQRGFCGEQLSGGRAEAATDEPRDCFYGRVPKRAWSPVLTGQNPMRKTIR